MSNEPDQDLDEPEEEVISPDSHKRGFLAKALVVLTVLAFMVYSLPNFSYLFSSRLDFLEQNRTLQEDPVVRKCRPAVVNIVAVGDGDSLHTILHQGSGFNISPAGIVITNQHVVAGAHTISISFADGSKYFTDRYRTLPGIDIAIITFAGKNLPALTINWQNIVQKDDTVTVIGNPLGLNLVAQRGKIDGFHKVNNIQAPVFDIKIAANPGSSGSPVLNKDGQVVGVIFASTTINDNGGAEPRALAIPTASLAGLAEQ